MVPSLVRVPNLWGKKVSYKIQHEVIHIKSAKECIGSHGAIALCRRTLKNGSIKVGRWYTHKDKGDFFIMITIGGMEFRSVNNYSECPDAKKVANRIKKHFFEPTPEKSSWKSELQQ